MSIDGTYAFVYGGVNGLGVGVFTIASEQFRGIDFVGGRYEGTACENDDGSVALDIEFEVRPGMVLVQGTAPQDVSHRRHIVHNVPADFGDGHPLQIPSPPGVVTLMIKRVPDEYSRALSDDVSVSIGNWRVS